MMMKIALGIEYDGSDFHGWQAQSSKIRTVEQIVQQALSEIAAREVALTCAGRTDTGVHASGQVVHIETTAQRTMHSWVLGTNTYLPHDIAVKWATQVSEDFHARFSAIRRHYRYTIYNHRSRSALHAKQATWVPQPLDCTTMLAASRCLLGEHDFTSFRASECQAKSPRRTVEAITLTQQKEVLTIDICANAFLHHMVRNIVGTLIKVGEGKRSIDWVEQVLQVKDRKQAGPTASPQGLCLIGVDYPDLFQLS